MMEFVQTDHRTAGGARPPEAPSPGTEAVPRGVGRWAGSHAAAVLLKQKTIKYEAFIELRMDMNNAIGAPVPGRAAAEIEFLSVRSAPSEQPRCWAGPGGPGPCCCPWGLPAAGGGTRGSASQPPADGSTLSAPPGASPALSVPSPCRCPQPGIPHPLRRAQALLDAARLQHPPALPEGPPPASPTLASPCDPRHAARGRQLWNPRWDPAVPPPPAAAGSRIVPAPRRRQEGKGSLSSLALRSAAWRSGACFGGTGKLFSPGLQAFVLCPLLVVGWHLPLRTVAVAPQRWKRALVPSPVPEQGWLPARVPGHSSHPCHVPRRQLLPCARGPPAAPPLRPGALELSVALPIAAALLLPQPRTRTRRAQRSSSAPCSPSAPQGPLAPSQVCGQGWPSSSALCYLRGTQPFLHLIYLLLHMGGVKVNTSLCSPSPFPLSFLILSLSFSTLCSPARPWTGRRAVPTPGPAVTLPPPLLSEMSQPSPTPAPPHPACHIPAASPRFVPSSPSSGEGLRFASATAPHRAGRCPEEP